MSSNPQEANSYGTMPETPAFDLYVAMFVPDVEDNHWYHWSFAVCGRFEADTSWYQYDAVRTGKHSAFRIDYRNVDPRASKSCLQPMLYLASVEPHHSQKLFDTIHKVQPPKKKKSWNCQTYIYDVVSALETKGLVSRDAISQLNAYLQPYEGKQPEDLKVVHHDMFVRRPKGTILSSEFVQDTSYSDN